MNARTTMAAAILLVACDEQEDAAFAPAPGVVPHRVPADFDPLARARAMLGVVGNPEAAIPPVCYTKTGIESNPCWVCHTESASPYGRSDLELQGHYAFSEAAHDNRWTNLFEDRRKEAAALGDDAVLAWVREDNYGALRAALRGLEDFPGYIPDLDWGKGFDEQGFARDGSEWRALRYVPFPGMFWPTNGNADDVFIRLPEAFRGPTRDHYRINLAILEAAIAARPSRRTELLDRPVEPLDERVAGLDLDGDGALGPTERIRGLPVHFVGDAAAIAVERYVYPQGTEFLHSVRYLDPEAPGFAAKRMKELRYMSKVERLDRWAANRANEEAVGEKDEGRAPRYRGDAFVGLLGANGWQLQGYIEDGSGRLRLQTDEEHRVCMGCHAGIGVTIDGTFAFARKVPGAEGFRLQDLAGIPDVPEDGHDAGEVLTYLRRVRAGDELRANDEMRARFFPGGVLDEAAVVGRDLAALLLPSARRALDLDRAYIALVRRDRFELGRDAPLAPPENVHAHIDEETAARTTYADGRLALAW
jgi:hypothetical protein